MIIAKKMNRELATPASTPRREKTIPSGAAMKTTTKHDHGNAHRSARFVRYAASCAAGKSELYFRYSRNSGTERFCASSCELAIRHGVSDQSLTTRTAAA